MKFCVLLLGISSLMISTCVGQTKLAQTKSMNKRDLAEHGFAIVLPDEPGFAETLKWHGFSAPPSLKAVVVRNTSKQGVAAFGIQYMALCTDGTELPVNSVVYTAPQGLLDTGQPKKSMREPIIEAGGSRVISPAGIVSAKVPSGTGTWFEMVPACAVVGLTVKADLVVYEDGRAYGPDDMNVLGQLQTNLAAQQDLVQEISGRVAGGEEIAPVLADISARLPNRDLHGGAPIEDETLYVKFRRHYVRLLTAEQRRSGDSAVAIKLRQFAFTVMPTIRREGGN